MSLHGVTLPGDLPPDIHERAVLLLERRHFLIESSDVAKEAVGITIELQAITVERELREREREVEQREAAVERFRRAWKKEVIMTDERDLLRREAAVERLREAIPEKREYRQGTPVAKAPEPRPDDCPIGKGSLSGYSNQGCRCDACREAARTYQRHWQRIRRGPGMRRRST
jgi:hypothetical protein